MFWKSKRKKDNEILANEIVVEKQRVSGLTKKVIVLEKELIEIKVPLKKIEDERDELKKMVRKQTEADILINALKAVGIIHTHEKIDYFARNSQLLANQQRAGSMNTSLMGLNTLGAIRSAFGPYG